MKIRAKYPEYPMKTPNMPPKNAPSMGFEGNLAAKKEPVIDRILKKEFAQKLFDMADRNPHLLQVISIGVLGMTIRPATLLAIPGAEKEDKQYIAAKSIIGTAMFVASQLLVSVPLDKSLKKIGEIAQKNPKSRFYKYSPKQLKAYSFLISNAIGLTLTLATSSFLTVKLTTKIMNKLFAKKDSNANNDTQKLQGKERDNL